MLNKSNRSGKLVRQARQSKNMSQGKLGTMLGLKTGATQYISNIERGLCQFPPKKIYRVAVILNITTEDLINSVVEDYKENLWKEVYKPLEA